MTDVALERVEYGGEGGLLLVADSPAALERASATAARAGLRIAASRPVEGAAEWLARHCAPATLIVEIERDSDGAAALLDRVRADAEAGLRRAVVSASPDLIDLVAARAWHGGIAILCDATEAERVTALLLADSPPVARLHDIGRGEGAALLHQLSEEVGRIANILASMSEEEATQTAAGRGGEEEEEGDSPAIDSSFVRNMIRVRRLRDQYLRGGLFADPAWDMLLDLMAARLERNRVAVSSLCIAAAVPATTALRWIKALTDRGLLVRAADPADGRRVYIELSDETARALSAYLRAARRISQLIV